MKGFPVRDLNKHKSVFSEGDQGEEAYLLLEGKVEISSQSGGRKKVLAVLTPVTVFGEMAIFLEGQRRTATAVTLADSKLVVISRENFKRYLGQSPQVISAVVNVLVNRLRAATRKSLMVPNLHQALAQVLLSHSRQGVKRLAYGEFVELMAGAFACESARIEEKLDALIKDQALAVEHDDAEKPESLVISDPDRLEAIHKGAKRVTKGE